MGDEKSGETLEADGRGTASDDRSPNDETHPAVAAKQSLTHAGADDTGPGSARDRLPSLWLTVPFLGYLIALVIALSALTLMLRLGGQRSGLAYVYSSAVGAFRFSLTTFVLGVSGLIHWTVVRRLSE